MLQHHKVQSILVTYTRLCAILCSRAELMVEISLMAYEELHVYRRSTARTPVRIRRHERC
jgi:glutaminase